jgi:hypothetical protein
MMNQCNKMLKYNIVTIFSKCYKLAAGDKVFGTEFSEICQFQGQAHSKF